MSFEEKKTLAWNQEQHRKWKSSSQGENLVPFRDSASSLIDSNLKGLSSSKALDSLSSLPLSTSYIPNNWAPNSTATQQPMSLGGTQHPMSLGGTQQPMSLGGSQQPMSLVGSPQPMSLGGTCRITQQPMSLIGTPPQSMSLGGISRTSQPMSFAGTYPSMATSPPHGNLQHQSSLDLKSLDNLLPHIGNKSNLTLSQMSKGVSSPVVRNVELPSSPILPLSNFVKPPPANSAKNDLEDLLG